MNESNEGQSQSFELPKPVDSSSSSSEQAPTPEVNTQPSGAPATNTPAIDPAAVAKPVPTPVVTDDSKPEPTTDLGADDLDVIEKEWVKKAKEIIERTSNDPHQQKDELGAFSEEYKMKRYGKEPKLDK